MRQVHCILLLIFFLFAISFTSLLLLRGHYSGRKVAISQVQPIAVAVDLAGMAAAQHEHNERLQVITHADQSLVLTGFVAVQVSAERNLPLAFATVSFLMPHPWVPVRSGTATDADGMFAVSLPCIHAGDLCRNQSKGFSVVVSADDGLECEASSFQALRLITPAALIRGSDGMLWELALYLDESEVLSGSCQCSAATLLHGRYYSTGKLWLMLMIVFLLAGILRSLSVMRNRKPRRMNVQKKRTVQQQQSKGRCAQLTSIKLQAILHQPGTHTTILTDASLSNDGIREPCA